VEENLRGKVASSREAGSRNSIRKKNGEPQGLSLKKRSKGINPSQTTIVKKSA